MAQVTITLNGRSYPIACGEGEEQRILDLAHSIDQRIKALVQSLGQVGEARLLVLSLLTLADELADAKARSVNGHGDGKTMASGIDALARRIETVAARLESAKI